MCARHAAVRGVSESGNSSAGRRPTKCRAIARTSLEADSLAPSIHQPLCEHLLRGPLHQGSRLIRGL